MEGGSEGVLLAVELVEVAMLLAWMDGEAQPWFDGL